MNRNIDGSGEESLLNFFRKQAFAPGLHQRSRLKVVASSSDDVDPGCYASAIQLGSDETSLPQSQLRTSGANRQNTCCLGANCHAN
jgi:hypothetical protein